MLSKRQAAGMLLQRGSNFLKEDFLYIDESFANAHPVLIEWSPSLNSCSSQF